MTAPRPDSDESLAEAQLARLRKLLETIVPGNGFYTSRLRAAGLDAGVASLDEYRRRMPYTTKAELARDQADQPPWGTNLTWPLERYARLHQTSSTTGTPLRWLDTPESWSWMLDGWQEVFRAAGVTAEDRVFLAFSFGPFIGLWMAFDAAAAMGCLTIPGGAMSSHNRLRAIVANRVTTLCCTPTYALRLGEVAAGDGIDLSAGPVRRIVVGGEPGASVPAVRARVQRLWPGARLFDHYGMTEVGPVTYQCPHRDDVVHVLEHRYLVEVVDPDTGEARRPDAEVPGELVLTTLGREGSPVLRYRTGDLVRSRPRARCECGRRTITFEGGVIGRVDDMIFVRGVNLYPAAVDQIVRECAGVAEYRVEIDEGRSLTEMKILVEPEPGAGDGTSLCRRLERAFRDAWNLRIATEPVAPGTLPRFELKARRWIRKGARS